MNGARIKARLLARLRDVDWWLASTEPAVDGFRVRTIRDPNWKCSVYQDKFPPAVLVGYVQAASNPIFRFEVVLVPENVRVAQVHALKDALGMLRMFVGLLGYDAEHGIRKQVVRSIGEPVAWTDHQDG